MNTTVKEICKNFLSDDVLRQYSYLGRRNKPRFKEYDNLTRVIVSSTVDSMKRAYRDIHGKDKEETVQEEEANYLKVKDYFTKEYIKRAEKRYNDSLNG